MRYVPDILDQTRTTADIKSLKPSIAVTTSQIIKIEGVFSGTLSYIFNEFSKVEGGDVKFSQVVKIAKDKGYTVSSSRFTRKM
jgi:homoserine dehydrogenase